MSNLAKFDLEERTLNFAKEVRSFGKKIGKTLINVEDLKQLMRSSGSIGANYIEANEAFSRKDFVHKIKICRKESKETEYWLRLINFREKELVKWQGELIQEAYELRKIFGSIVEKSKR